MLKYYHSKFGRISLLMKTTKLPQIHQRKLDENTVVFEDNNNDSKDISDLDLWSQNVPKCRTKNINTNGINFLYKNVNKYIRKTQLTDFKTSDAGLYITQLDGLMSKIKSHNYDSLFRNIEYCSGYYQNQINQILKKIDYHRQVLKEKLRVNSEEILERRNLHIKRMETQSEEYKIQIPKVRQEIEEAENTIKPLKKMVYTLGMKKQEVLLFSLGLGYDVREDGLIWILRELRRVPEIHQFPAFLTQRQIKFIIEKYLSEQSLKDQEKGKQNIDMGTNLIMTYELVHRRKKRQLSMIREDQALDKLRLERKQNLGTIRQYMSEQTMNMIEEANKIKATKYEIIYNQTSRKLRQLCNDRIHGRKKKRRSSNFNFGAGEGSQTLIQQFDTMLESSLSNKKKEEMIKIKQQKELNEIVRLIRMEKYNSNLWLQRNPITIVSCLVGWRRAKKILQCELHMIF